MGTVSRLPERSASEAAVIASEEEALIVTRDVAAQIEAIGAGDDDGLRRALDIVIRSGLLGVTIPPENGGADISNSVLGEIMLSIAAVDTALAACLASHFHALELLRGRTGINADDFFYSRALAGDLFLLTDGVDHELLLTPENLKPGWRLRGRVESANDLILADWIAIPVTPPRPASALALVPRMMVGLHLAPDAAEFDNIHVDADCLVTLSEETAHTVTAVRYLLDAGVRLGRADTILKAIISRLSIMLERAREPYLAALGLAIGRLESGRTMLDHAGLKIDAAQVNPGAVTASMARFSAAIADVGAEEALAFAKQLTELRRGSPVDTLSGKYADRHAAIGAMLFEGDKTQASA